MRLNCPLCGPRDRREFYYSGSEDYLSRPAGDDPQAWDDMLHLRVNPAGDLSMGEFHQGTRPDGTLDNGN